MGTSHYAVLLVLSLGAVEAGRIKSEAVVSGNSSVGMGKICDLSEDAEALGYGIKGKFPVKSCMLECKFNKILHETFLEKFIAEPDTEGESCKCNYSPRYWEGGTEVTKKHWFQFRINSLHTCDKEDCKDIFFTWGNMFLKKMHYPGANERMPVSERLESQENYAVTCTEGFPEAIVLPSPGSKITELRLQIAAETDPAKKAQLQALLDELMGDKEVEIFEYDLEGDWGPEHHADVAEGDMHTYHLKPCKSNLGAEVDGNDLHTILEQCGPGALGESMKVGALRWHYKPEKPWGPEQVCDKTLFAEKCALLEDEVAKDGWNLLSFRMKPCMTPSEEQEVTELTEVLKEEHCGAPTLGVTLLPVKVSASKKFDAYAPEDELTFPCP